MRQTKVGQGPAPAARLDCAIVRVLLALAAASACASSAAPAQQLDPAAVRAALLEGVGPVVGPGWPGPLALFEARAVPVLGGEVRPGILVPVVAASTLGRGRVVAFGHDGYLTQPSLADPGLQQLIRNAVRWAGGTSRPTVLLVRAGDVAPVLAGVADVRVHGAEPVTESALQGVQVVVTVPWVDDWWMQSLDELRRFAERGGGLVVSGLGWGERQLQPGLTLSQLPPSRLLVDAGIGWGGAALEQGDRPLTVATSPLLNGAVALQELQRRPLRGAEAEAALEAVRNAIELAPPAGSLRAGAAQLALRAWTALPVQGRPLYPGVQPELAIAYRIMEVLQVDSGAHPAASDFPGAVPAAAPRVSDTIPVGPGGRRWVSTGLYAAPGDRIRVQVLPGSVPPPVGAVFLRVGAHTDDLYPLEHWERAPVLSRRYPLGEGTLEVRQPFGGLIYVDQERALDVPYRVAIEGAVRAPRFVLGQTRLEDWRERARGYAAPWGELESGSVIITVQSSFLRTLERPDLALYLWDRVQEANADLAGWGPGENRPMRLVFDRQIGVGYMHSGYPIMALLVSQPTAVDLPAAVRANAGDIWGLLHELGHNHQSPDWTFEGAGEVTVNLFTMYALERALGVPGVSVYPGLSAAARTANLRRYFGQGARFGTWKQEPFIALTMYWQVVDAFGWEPFRAVFREYRALDPAQKQWSDDQRRDQWLMRLSRAVGRNLGPFFDAWGIPVSNDAKAAVASLPPWMPEPGFPARYRQ